MLLGRDSVLWLGFKNGSTSNINSGTYGRHRVSHALLGSKDIAVGLPVDTIGERGRLMKRRHDKCLEPEQRK